MNLQDYFPGLAQSPYHITSPADPDYNCVAWAAHDASAWWWPDPMGIGYWPAAAPRLVTLDAFVAAFQSIGFAPGATPDLEPGWEKVALFAKSDVPTHAARQLPNGRWTSKLGPLEDIEHELDVLTGSIYGQVVCILRRPIASEGL
jgi:hypothetical protein